ncbi:trypsin-like peptidase domain-containing protein [candidate division KSB1 bacterium]|nr:trypsin-like peptidase domain-containing protein [candidate division KSB1 bacterium]
MRNIKYRMTSLFLLMVIGLPVFSCQSQSDRYQDLDDHTDGEMNDLDKQIIEQEITQSRQNVLTRAIADVSPAVVGINVISVRTRVVRSPFYDPFFEQFLRPYQYKERVKSLGSGFLISPNGYILTNEHVIHEAIEIVVTTTDGEQHKAELIGRSEKDDVALLKIDGESFPYIPLGDSKDMIIGEWAIALGNPFGLFDINSKPTVTVGVISATGMDFNQIDNRVYNDMIQTDASINGGNSGGPLVNSLGQCVGINAFIISGSEYSNTSVGIGFAIPINRVKEILPDLKRIGNLDKPKGVGIAVENINWLVARTLGIAEGSGVIVSKVETESIAEKAGLEVGDVIVAMDGYLVRSKSEYNRVYSQFNKQDEKNISLRIYRYGQLYDVKLEIKQLIENKSEVNEND